MTNKLCKRSISNAFPRNCTDSRSEWASERKVSESPICRYRNRSELKTQYNRSSSQKMNFSSFERRSSLEIKHFLTSNRPCPTNYRGFKPSLRAPRHRFPRSNFRIHIRATVRGGVDREVIVFNAVKLRVDGYNSDTENPAGEISGSSVS